VPDDRNPASPADRDGKQGRLPTACPDHIWALSLQQWRQRALEPREVSELRSRAEAVGNTDVHPLALESLGERALLDEQHRWVDVLRTVCEERGEVEFSAAKVRVRRDHEHLHGAPTRSFNRIG